MHRRARRSAQPLGGIEMSAQAHYDALFSRVEQQFGSAADETMTGIIGFSAGGPVSICRFGSQPVYVTCELSLTPEQKPSAEGLRYELLSRLALSLNDTQDFLTSLGTLSLEAKLGDRHTVDVSTVSPSQDIQKIRLSLFSSSEIAGVKYGIYEVCDAA